MYLKQIYTGCPSEYAYFADSNGEAIIIDPLRSTDEYLKLAKDRNAEIKYIFGTHFHADFVSSPIDLARETGATIVYGPETETNFPFHLAKDGERFKIGNIIIEAIHTPGHTIESTCYLLKDEANKPHCLFTGNTLFVGDVGRPDFRCGNMPGEELASMMYDSFQNKMMPLPDDVIVYPGHGVGSSHGKNVESGTSSTIGIQKKTNYALQPQTREEFIKAVTTGSSEAPSYFAVNAQINKQGYCTLEEIRKKGLTPLTLKDFKEKMTKEVIILDIRNAAAFKELFIPESIFIGLEGRFEEWAGSLLPFHQRMILVTEPGLEEEAIVRLARVGFNKVEGYLEGGFETWKNSAEKKDMIIDIDADELAMDLPFDANLTVLDVRKPNEFAEGHIKDALNLNLADMTDVALVAQLEENQNLYVHSASGYRSVIACSLLKRQGYHSLRNVNHGWGKIKEQKIIKIEKEASVLN